MIDERLLAKLSVNLYDGWRGRRVVAAARLLLRNRYNKIYIKKYICLYIYIFVLQPRKQNLPMHISIDIYILPTERRVAQVGEWCNFDAILNAYRCRAVACSLVVLRQPQPAVDLLNTATIISIIIISSFYETCLSRELARGDNSLLATRFRRLMRCCTRNEYSPPSLRLPGLQESSSILADYAGRLVDVLYIVFTRRKDKGFQKSARNRVSMKATF